MSERGDTFLPRVSSLSTQSTSADQRPTSRRSENSAVGLGSCKEMTSRIPSLVCVDGLSG